MAFKKLVQPKQIKVQTPKTMSNAGEQNLDNLFKETQHLKPVSEQKIASKFSGLKRYLKRSI